MITKHLGWDDVHPENFTGILVFPSGDRFWYLDGKFHRLDGPACEYIDGYEEYWICDEFIDDETAYWLLANMMRLKELP